jgi:antitoxin (DNA-binding transcriptional repressor) of toxin-antitoxin stability system
VGIRASEPSSSGHPPVPSTKFIDLTTPLRYPKLMQVTLQYAAEHLAELASAARRGEEVEIAQPDEPPIKLVVSTSAPFTPKPGRRILGAGRGEMVVPSEAEWQAMDEELEQLINGSPLYPAEEE